MSARISECDEDSKSLLKKRLAYTLAAGAAAAAGGFSDAEGAIVYSGIADFVIDQGNSRTLRFDAGDYDDVLLKNFIFSGVNYQALTVGYSPGKVVGFSTNGEDPFGEYVKALSPGFMIDSTSVGPTFYGTLAFGSGNPNAEFRNITNGYIGLSFPVGPIDLFYAWIRVDINNDDGTFVIRDWAWEDQVGVGIVAGDTGLLPGDFNLDGNVDGIDFLIWQRGGSPVPLGAGDLEDWQDNYGMSVPLNAGVTVPEPLTLGMLAAGSAGVLMLRRLRNR